MKTKTKWTAVTVWVILIALSGVALAQGGRVLCDYLQFTENATPALSSASKAVMYVDSTAHNLQISINGGGYVPIATGTGLIGITTSDNTALGIGAAGSILTSTGLTALGNNAGVGVTSGNSDVFVGNGAGGSGAGAAQSSNVFVGTGSGAQNEADNNTFLGDASGTINSSGYGNLFAGKNSGATNTTGDSNVCLGYGSDVATSGTQYAIALGLGTIAPSNTFVVGGSGASITDMYLGLNVGGGEVANSTVTIHASGHTSGNNKSANKLYLAGGIGTGTGRGGNVVIQAAPSVASGNTVHTVADRYIVVAKGLALTDAVAVTVASWDLSPNSCAGGRILATIQCFDGTDFQSMTQTIEFAIADQGGAFTSDIVSTTGAKITTGGSTLTTTWTVSGSGDIKVSADTSLTPSGTNSFVLYYTIENNSEITVRLP